TVRAVWSAGRVCVRGLGGGEAGPELDPASDRLARDLDDVGVRLDRDVAGERSGRVGDDEVPGRGRVAAIAAPGHLARLAVDREGEREDALVLPVLVDGDARRRVRVLAHAVLLPVEAAGRLARVVDQARLG